MRRLVLGLSILCLLGGYAKALDCPSYPLKDKSAEEIKNYWTIEFLDRGNIMVKGVLENQTVIFETNDDTFVGLLAKIRPHAVSGQINLEKMLQPDGRIYVLSLLWTDGSARKFQRESWRIRNGKTEVALFGKYHPRRDLVKIGWNVPAGTLLSGPCGFIYPKEFLEDLPWQTVQPNVPSPKAQRR